MHVQDNCVEFGQYGRQEIFVFMSHMIVMSDSDPVTTFSVN